MAEPWVFGVITLIVGGIALGGGMFGYDSCTGPVPWTEAFGTSPFLSKRGMLALNIAFAVVSVTMYALYVESSWYSQWPGYLTNWFITTQTAFFCLLPVATWTASHAGKEVLLDVGGGDAQDQPNVITVATVLFHIQLPLSFAVVFLYWNLVLPVGKLCVLNHSADGCEEMPHYTALWVHLYNPLMCTSSFLLGRIPFRWSNAGWLMLFGSVYMAWTLLYQLLKVNGGEPLYASIDWRSPYHTLWILSVVTSVVFPGVLSLYWGLGQLRDKALTPPPPYAARLVATATP